MLQPVAKSRLRWLSRAEGGRNCLPSGPVYASTGHLDGDPEIFSLVLVFEYGPPAFETNMHEVDLGLLAPENLPEIVKQIKPGARLIIQEGRRNVAIADVLSVRMEGGGTHIGVRSMSDHSSVS